jgi:leucyl aminopeptidase
MVLHLTAAPSAPGVDLEALLLFEDRPLPGGVRRSARGTAEALGGPKTLGEAGEVRVLGGSPVQASIGLGKADEVDAEKLRRAAGQAIGLATDLKLARLAIHPPHRPSQIETEALAEGALLAAHARRPKPTITPKPETARPPEACTLVLNEPGPAMACIERAKTYAQAVFLARELGDVPANRLAPLELAERAATEARQAGLDTDVLDHTALEKLGAGLLLAVGAGSTRPPALGLLRYRPSGATHHVAVVGKGITFDAGGLNLKPGKGMAEMVHDKAGAAVAAAIAVGAARLELPVAVTAVLACAENLPGGSAYRPGDVLTALDHSTVEIVDTDAEGRLVLADALTYAVRLDEPKPADVVVDLATLTGSIVSALGNEAAGLFSNHDRLASRMLEAAALAGEPLWRMPILPGHRAQLKSERADRKQCADRWGDCAIAAAFLEAYVDRRPWLHLDIAGVSYNEGSPEWPVYHPKNGASGTGVRTVLRFLEPEKDLSPANRPG